MKQLRTLALLAICAFAISALAQQTPPADSHAGQGQGQGQGQGMGHKMPSVDEMVQTMTEKLSLTDDQKAKVTKIAEGVHKKMEGVLNDQSLSPDDRMAKMRAAHNDAVAQVRPILNDDQKKKLDDWQKEMQDHGHNKDGKAPQAGDHAHQ
jgi:periplasmic protein CpxP/Spy